ETRRALEALVSRQAAERAEDPDKKELVELLADMQSAYDSGDLMTYSAINGKLHSEIRRIAGNATARRILETLKSQVVRLQYQAIYLPGRAQHSMAEHVEIVEAICANDLDRAEAAMRKHLSGVVEGLKRTMERGRQTFF